MAPKQAMSKKNKEKKKNQAIADATFGLKNKNKSSKVQKYVSQVETTMKNNLSDADKKRAKEKKDKADKLAADEALRALLNEGLENQKGKSKATIKAEAAALGVDDSKKIEFSDSDSDSDDDYAYTNQQPRTEIHISDQGGESTGVEVFHELTLEDIIETQRAKLAAEGKQGTPVTAESFKAWQTAKAAKKQADAVARMKAEEKKKGKGTKGSILSGKELFNYNSSLFVDDDGCVDNQDDQLYLAEKQLREQREEEAAKEAARKAQREQDRLLEEHKAEIAHIKRVEEERLARCAQSIETIEFDEIIVNEMLFHIPEDYDIQEDFTPFEFDTPEEEPVAQKVDGVEVNEALFGGDDELDGLED
mmetsp:Transcript_17309/g.28950  ORF Transcript_17309/g.28950 Transcript_17309/m.28950 type:complete len:363 (-) Transcript_17309:88-1176(-)|eukprot:CAMPEP_0114422074 /NCGR_PEP_ID=MMETSP0103-20121206/5417_1 /TAXON_ID=37642 ORGANISM="Paraphysomonas imperforata, Strain PA2" /NCGR_SAMPLE_ID=MMETSP0103 /ASSEMBLY_ACC=CAM_ASM_000201 /LENGTH=362 /DNA_ID=CAMNT_0001590637 /DNA_START=21 /DNA_END=1109 /DNA_ORIENTATION=-